MPEFYSLHATAERLGISYLTAFKKVSKKEIPSVRIGRKILVPVAFINTLITKAMSGEETPAPTKA